MADKEGAETGRLLAWLLFQKLDKCRWPLDEEERGIYSTQALSVFRCSWWNRRKKSVVSRVWERGVGHIFGLVWFWKRYSKNFVFAIIDGSRIYNRRKDKLQSDFQIDSWKDLVITHFLKIKLSNKKIICMFCLHVCLCTTCVPGAQESQKRALVLLELSYKCLRTV